MALRSLFLYDTRTVAVLSSIIVLEAAGVRIILLVSGILLQMLVNTTRGNTGDVTGGKMRGRVARRNSL